MHKIAVVGDGNFPNSKGGGIGVAESVLFALDGFLEVSMVLLLRTSTGKTRLGSS
jgi:hypothetical protein